MQIVPSRSIDPARACELREIYRLKAVDPDEIQAAANSIATVHHVEQFCDREGYFITREMIEFTAQDCMAWGDNDYDNPEIASGVEWQERNECFWSNRSLESRAIWSAKQNAKPTWPRVKSRIKSKAVAAMLATAEALNLKDPENLVDSIMNLAALRPRIDQLLGTVVMKNLDGSVVRRYRNAKGNESLKSVRRNYLMHHGWDGKGAEPAWAEDIRVVSVRYLVALDGNGTGDRWIVSHSPSPKKVVSSYIDPEPGIGDDGHYRWMGAPLIFDPEGTYTAKDALRLSVAQFETCMVQGAQVEDDPILNELVGGDPVELDLEEGLRWTSGEDHGEVFDCRLRGCNGDYWDEQHLSHDEQFFYKLLKDMGEADFASMIIQRGLGPDRMGLIYTARGIVLEHYGAEPAGTPWSHNLELLSDMLGAMSLADWAEFKEYL